MSAEPDDATDTEQPLIERFTSALAHIIHEERPDAIGRPVTVAELYQDIAPYRRMRDLAGIEMHADYEHALIRVLSGEGDFARIDPDTARDALAIEAEAMDPDLSAYRKYAGCEVWLTPGPRRGLPPVLPRPVPPPAEPLSRALPEPPTPPPAALSVEDEAPAAPPIPRREVASAPDIEAALRATSEPPAPRASRPKEPAPPTSSRCGYCGQALPGQRDVRFCPHCGGDQTSRQCADCGEPLEAGWRFCVACGAAAEA